MAGFKSAIGHMSKEQLEAAVIREIASHAGVTGTTIHVIGDGGHFTKADVKRVEAVLNRLSKTKKPVTAPAIKLAHELVRHAREIDENKAHRGFSCGSLFRLAAQRLVKRG